MDLNRGRAFGVEALIRWRHPEHGLLPPARFIRMAESMGLTEPLGLWVMRQACRQIHQWNALGLADIKVAINLSARQFLDPDLTRFVHESLTAAGASPSQLEIELTETVATVDEDHTRSTFGALHDLGVTIAIDDFGSGYASMSQLRRLPFDKLKIDREFVTKVQERRDSQAICDAIITLGKGLGLRVLAEGAETEPEIRFLNDLGCNLFQGYYFARPMPPEDLIPSLSGLSSAAMALTAPARSRVHDLSAQTANA
jgi:EAL domain-containing protein (putative c-di-GMP-specific phosphodiesterase class I)